MMFCIILYYIRNYGILYDIVFYFIALYYILLHLVLYFSLFYHIIWCLNMHMGQPNRKVLIIRVSASGFNTCFDFAIKC